MMQPITAQGFWVRLGVDVPKGHALYECANSLHERPVYVVVELPKAVVVLEI